MSLTIMDILQDKGFQVFSVQPGTTIEEALHLMAAQKIGFVPVIQNDKIVGVFSERDFARLMAAHEVPPLSTPIREVMVFPVYFIKGSQTIQDCMTVMTAKHFRHLPVLEGEKLIGVISIGDVVRGLMREKDFTIEQLENLLWANLV